MRFYLLIFIGLFLGACASQNQVTADKPTGFNAVEAAKTRVSLGLTYLKNGNYVQAKANLDKALEFAPRFSDAHFGLAYYYQQVSEVAIAKQYYEQAMDLDRNNPDLVNSYGAFLCEIGDYLQAKEFLLKAATSKAYNRSAETYENLAICSHRQGNTIDALNYVRTALQHQPGRARSWYMFVELLIAKGQWQEAKLAYRQYEKVVPVTADTLNLAIEIEQGLGNPKVANGYREMLEALYPEQVGKPRKVILPAISGQVPVDSPFVQPVALASDSKVTRASVMSSSASKSQVQSTSIERPPVQNSAVHLSPDEGTLVEQAQVSYVPAKYHVLQKGETLYQISRRYSVTVQSLVDWNNILDVSNMSIGQKILVSQPTN